jgi:hypothetical protein
LARAVNSIAIGIREPVMTGIGLQVVLPLVGIRATLAHHEIMEMLEVLHALGNSYRLASSGTGLGVGYARFTLGFCRATIQRARFTFRR